MTVETEVANLTTAVDNLTAAVNVKKQTLDTAVSNAQTAVTDATSQVSLAAAEKVGAQTARDEAETHKNNAYTYSQSAASAVAYQDLTAIAQTKAENAVDVFVYDTSKDSDGGAWRHRTQHTSWYNEPLNTATRGSRKEFPAVAVIVAETNKVTIYDGDDPTLPMWMVFESNLNDILDFNQTGGGGGSPIQAISALNGILATGQNVTGNGQSARSIGFISDTAYRISDTARGGKRGYAGNIKQRNDGKGSYTIDSSIALVNLSVNDVAMTVLPDAPIDPATGLPIPTIAVATEGGVSVIKDDGTVVDIISDHSSVYSKATIVGFTKDFRIIHNLGSSSRYLRHHSIPTSDTQIDQWNPSTDDGITFYHTAGLGDFVYVNGANPVRCAVEGALGVDSGLTLWDENIQNVAESLVNYTTSDYNTGWMNGDIKLATLSDTDDTDLVGSELVTNGTFDDASNWSISSASPSSGISGGQAFIESSGSNARIEQNLTLVQGKTYILEFDLVSETGSGLAYVRIGYNDIIPTSASIPGKNSTSFVATDFQNLNFMTFASSGSSFTIDNISVRLAEPDRSVNGNGLQVFGTVQKNPVATGADLVAYSGFSSSNYLVQPYNSDLDFGTGDFCFMSWFKHTSTNQDTILDRENLGGGGSRLRIAIQSDTLIRVFLSGVGATDFQVSNPPINLNVWHFLTIVRRSGQLYMYVDGKYVAQVGSSVDFDNATALTYIGQDADGTDPWEGYLALLRISGTAPTAEQIKKIYEDEKVLFQENAKATLHGTSDAVTALAYDDTTELLHVGTSAGRSVFQGLRRVDNTTDAVGVAISASNGLVAEE